jgi:hypothetical protein
LIVGEGRVPLGKRQVAGQDHTAPLVAPEWQVWELPERQMTAVLRDTIDLAARSWPAMIAESSLSEAQKRRLLDHLENHAGVKAWRRRNKAA